MKKKFYFLMVLTFVSVYGMAQVTVPKFAFTMHPPNIREDVSNVEGSQYLSGDWAKGVVKLNDGRTYKDIELKYDQLADKLIFKNGSDASPLEVVDPVSEFTISYIADNLVTTKHFCSGYGKEKTAFDETLVNGGVQFLKRTEKSIKELHVYNSATITKSIDGDVKYYLCIAGQLRPIKKDKKSIFNALSDKQSQLEAFIKANTLNLKEEADIVRVLMYYNSI
jgi:hypothetical protein